MQKQYLSHRNCGVSRSLIRLCWATVINCYLACREPSFVLCWPIDGLIGRPRSRPVPIALDGAARLSAAGMVASIWFVSIDRVWVACGDLSMLFETIM